MMSHSLRTGRVRHRRDQCITRNQKAVYDWNESRHSDDDLVDIFSSEWNQRLTSWHTWLVKTYGSRHAHLDLSKLIDSPEDLEFKLFFFAHPIPTFSLWRVFGTFYDLDRTIYGTSSETDLPLEEWRQMKPFKYLKSSDVRRRWKAELKMLDKRIGCGDLTAEEQKSRMVDILGAVERLEYSLNLLEEDMGSEEDGKIWLQDWILSTVHDAFEDRCALIADALRP